MNEETLFEEALSRSPEGRTAFLDQACVGRPELRAAVEALLAAHEKSGNILDKLPGPVRGFRPWPGLVRRRPRADGGTRLSAAAPGHEDGRLPRDFGDRHRDRGALHAAADDRRRGHGRGLGRQTD